MIELAFRNSIPLDGRKMTPEELQEWREARQCERDKRDAERVTGEHAESFAERRRRLSLQGYLEATGIDLNDWHSWNDSPLPPLPHEVKLECGGCDPDGTWWGPVDCVPGLSAQEHQGNRSAS